MTRKPPPIIWGAAVLAALSLIWSAYAITDLMASGPFGLSVAIAGDIGWITVLWAEYKRLALGGKTWPAPLAGWVIAISVAGLLVLHGIDANSTPQAIAGPFVVLVGKTVWTFALAAMRDPAALTTEQEGEIHAVMRESEYAARLRAAERSKIEREADAEIDRIRAEARTVLARDEADFEVSLERLSKRAELHRRTPLALPANTTPEHTPPAADFDDAAEQAIDVIGEHEHDPPNTANAAPNSPSSIPEQIANKAITSTNPDREQPRIADLVREQIATTPSNPDAVRNVLAIRPDANKESVAAAVRRERRRAAERGEGFYP